MRFPKEGPVWNRPTRAFKTSAMKTTPARYPLAPWLALPFTRHELPGWGKLFEVLKIDGKNNDLWRDAPTKVIRGKLHGYRMDLDLSDWAERLAFFLGRYYDHPTQMLLTEALRSGDRMVDVGANIGMVTLHAASLVGPGGRVDAFEPNPLCQGRIEAHLARNGIEQVELHRVALSDQHGTLILRTLPDHTGTATLAELTDEDKKHFTVEISVPVEVGDEVLGRDTRPVDLIKVDVEGFECRALRGMENVLRRWRPPVLTEVISEWLVRAGSSPADLLDLMAGHGYRGYRMGQTRRGLRQILKLEAFDRFDPDESSDVLWVHPEGRNRGRLRSLPG